MKTIEEQIEALTQELRPYPKGTDFYVFNPAHDFHKIDSIFVYTAEYHQKIIPQHCEIAWTLSLFASTNKAEVEEYADCYKRLKLYQLIGKQKEKEFTLKWLGNENYGTDFFYREHGQGYRNSSQMLCVLGGVWFAREEDRLEALKICGITKEFQEKCAKYGLGCA